MSQPGKCPVFTAPKIFLIWFCSCFKNNSLLQAPQDSPFQRLQRVNSQALVNLKNQYRVNRNVWEWIVEHFQISNEKHMPNYKSNIVPFIVVNICHNEQFDVLVSGMFTYPPETETANQNARWVLIGTPGFRATGSLPHTSHLNS